MPFEMLQMTVLLFAARDNNSGQTFRWIKTGTHAGCVCLAIGEQPQGLAAAHQVTTRGVEDKTQNRLAIFDESR